MSGTVLVTGAGKRLGREISLRLAAEGYDIALHYFSSRDEAEQVASQIDAMGRRASLHRANLSKVEACKALISGVTAAHPDLTGLVNSASVFAPDRFDRMQEQFYRQQMAVNSEAPLFLTQAFHGAITQAGWVVNMIDCKVDQLTPDFFAYTLSKLALQDVTRMCAMACAPKLRVNGIAPGLVLRSGNQTQATFEAEHDQIPLRVGPTAQDIAETVAYLARVPSLTGQIIAVDGGRHFYTPSKLAAEFEVPPKPEQS